MKKIKGGITSPRGFLASGIHCGLKKEKKDLALIYSKSICNGAAVYTQNLVKGEPIYVTKDHLSNGKAQAIIINSGNANTCTGEKGRANAYRMTQALAEEIDVSKEDVLVASTGIIGEQLPVEKIESAIPSLVSNLSKKGNTNASKAILTTDKRTKEIAMTIEIDNKEITIGAMAKGSGMIEPNMATMLSFITTDINMEQGLLEEALVTSVDRSYNRISVDGDTSTNDMVTILANGESKNRKIVSKNNSYYKFLEALDYINVYLAKEIARDGEGASKLIECQVKGANYELEAVKLAKSVINSSLVKTAIFGGDANWGRILCAVGYAGADIDINKVDIDIEGKAGIVNVCRGGKGHSFSEKLANDILKCHEIRIIVSLNMGQSSALAWGCDLSYDYVKINGSYRS